MRYHMLTEDLILRAGEKARDMGHSYVGSAHMLIALAGAAGTVGQLLRLMGVDPSLTQEMAACIPDPAHERRLEGEELGKILNSFLESLPYESRVIFLRRYWYLDTVAEIADRCGITQSKVKTQLHRTRAKLSAFLEKEGITV